MTIKIFIMMTTLRAVSHNIRFDKERTQLGGLIMLSKMLLRLSRFLLFRRDESKQPFPHLPDKML